MRKERYLKIVDAFLISKRFPLGYFSFIKYCLKNCKFLDLYKTKPTKCNNIFDSDNPCFINSIFSNVAGCMIKV